MPEEGPKDNKLVPKVNQSELPGDWSRETDDKPSSSASCCLSKSPSMLSVTSGDHLIPMDHAAAVEVIPSTTLGWRHRSKQLTKKGFQKGLSIVKSKRFGDELLRTIVVILTFGTITSLMMIAQMESDRWFDEYTKSLTISTIQMRSMAVFREVFATDPLHDRIFEWIPDWSRWRHFLPDLCLTTMLGTTVFFNLIWIQRKRIQFQGLVVFRRFLWIMTVLYLFRMLTFIVTTVPNPIHNCVPKYANVSDFDAYLTLIKDMASGRVSACTDNIYSGHTALTTVMVFTFWMYSGHFILRAYAIAHGAVIIGAILLTRLHYTVDVIIGMFMSAFVFLAFHFLLTITVDDNLLGEFEASGEAQGFQRVLYNERRLLHRIYTATLNRAVWWIDGFDLRLRNHLIDPNDPEVDRLPEPEMIQAEIEVGGKDKIPEIILNDTV